ncbi:hypothetical protein HNQ69_001100 [Bartonella callosciuri]|uniref:Uncharacterized protein n=1 Tax=Bartonella callosciuri TaxID=686223 RepID=A0A840P103_9HYPH|nr:hypothetical protein [Bartonella callosciuri]
MLSFILQFFACRMSPIAFWSFLLRRVILLITDIYRLIKKMNLSNGESLFDYVKNGILNFSNSCLVCCFFTQLQGMILHAD